jgi:hypothetical protein
MGFFAGSVLALPIAAWVGGFGVTAISSFRILLETGILAMNRGRCPMRDRAAKFTEAWTA